MLGGGRSIADIALICWIKASAEAGLGDRIRLGEYRNVSGWHAWALAGHGAHGIAAGS